MLHKYKININKNMYKYFLYKDFNMKLYVFTTNKSAKYLLQTDKHTVCYNHQFREFWRKYKYYKTEIKKWKNPRHLYMREITGK
jgi:hypothetical protein